MDTRHRSTSSFICSFDAAHVFNNRMAAALKIEIPFLLFWETRKHLEQVEIFLAEVQKLMFSFNLITLSRLHV